MKGLTKNLHEIYLEASHFLNKVYPDFVTSRRPDRIEGIPVFTFHSIRPKTFEEQLGFLKENNYITVSVDQFYNYLSGKVAIPERAILLTIDDGRKSVWEYGFPLLKKFNFRATVFIIPGHTKDRDHSPSPKSSPPRGEDLITQSSSHWGEDRIKSSLSPLGRGEGEGGFEDLGEEPETDKEILSWQEILLMRDSGLIDFGSHTLYHNRIFTEPEIVDFLGPSYRRIPYDYPAVPLGYETSILEKEPSEFYGLPIYMGDSLMSGKPRFIDDQEFREECIKYYRERFNSPSPQSSPRWGEEIIKEDPLPLGERVVRGDWKKEMFIFVSEYSKKNQIPERFLSPEETTNEIYSNLSDSKKILEERLDKPVNHLCYPFGIWSELSTEMAKKAGYLSAFCAYIPDRPINKSGDDPYKIVRLKDDYIFRLPGKGRKSLLEIFLRKFRRRLKGERVY